MPLYSILILAEVWRFMQAAIRWDFGTLQEFFGFSGECLRSAREGPPLDGIHGLPWKHNRNMFKNKGVKRIHVCGIKGTLIYASFFFFF